MTSQYGSLAANLEIEDDMDDFDDVLDQFKAANDLAPPTKDPITLPTTTTLSPPENRPNTVPDIGSDSDEEDWQKTLPDDFARDLAEGMEALLASLKEEDGGEFKKHLEAMMVADGDPSSADIFQALGARPGTDKNVPSTSTSNSSNTRPGGSHTDGSTNTTQNFQDAIRSTMDKLKESDASAKSDNQSASPDDQLAALFEQMMSAEGGIPDETQLQNMLQGFMEELMSKEIMYEPLRDMNRQYPAWLAENRATLAEVDIDRYQTQSEIVAAVVEKFEDPGWDADERVGGDKFAERQHEVVELLTKMQDCGAPPQEILGEMPQGLMGEDGMPNPEQCTIS